MNRPHVFVSSLSTSASSLLLWALSSLSLLRPKQPAGGGGYPAGLLGLSTNRLNVLPGIIVLCPYFVPKTLLSFVFLLSLKMLQTLHAEMVDERARVVVPM